MYRPMRAGETLCEKIANGRLTLLKRYRNDPALALAAYRALPPEFLHFTGDVMIAIADFPEEDVIEEMELERTALEVVLRAPGFALTAGATGGQSGFKRSRANKRFTYSTNLLFRQHLKASSFLH